MAGNCILSYGGYTPSQGLTGYQPRDYYNPDSEVLEAQKGATHVSPDPLRLKAKEAIIKSIVEHRLAVANNTRVQKLELGLLEPNP